MFPVTSLNAANFQASQHAGGMRRARGNYNGAAAAWLWLFDTNGHPLTTTAGLLAPVPLYPAAPFFIETELGSLQFNNGLYAAVSSTQEAYTASASTMDITVEMDDPEEPLGNSYAGDTVTGVDSLVVYASSANENLYAIDVTNSGGATAYLQMFTAAAPAAGQAPHLQWTVTAGQTRSFKFGRQGIHPSDVSESLGGVNTVTQGCYLYGSSTAGTFTATVATQWKIQSEYGAPQNG
jgi:hypothetical protein